MSEIDEPPAKVLKIDNIDGITRVTEVHGLPEDLIDGHAVAEDAGNVGGGRELEQEGHEEWLSEGILTDDDYNPASQGEADHTDSQLGTSHDEENTEDSMERLDTTAESESNIPALENEVNTAESEVNTAENEVNTAENEVNTAENEVNTTGSGMNKTESGENLDDTDGIVSTKYVIESERCSKMLNLKIGVKSKESEADSTESITNVTGSRVNVAGSKTNVAECKTNITEIKRDNANDSEVKESLENDVSQANKNSNVQGKDANICLEENIEETMKHLDGSKEDELKQDLFDSLLIKKVDVKNEKKAKPESKQEQDGNDTDDLLRMLGEDDGKTKKKLTKTVKDIRASVKSGNASSDDDDFVYEGSAVNKIKAAKTALARKQPMKAEPEDMGDGDDENDMSADDTKTMQSMFGMKTRNKSQTAKVQSKPNVTVRTPQVLVQRLPHTIKSTVRVIQKPPNAVLQAKVPQRQYQNKRLTQSPNKPKPVVMAQPPFVQSVDIKSSTTNTPTKQSTVKTTDPLKPSIIKRNESLKSTIAKTPESLKTSSLSMKTSPLSTKTSSLSNKTSSLSTKTSSLPTKTSSLSSKTSSLSTKTSSVSFKPTVKTADPFKPSLHKTVSSKSMESLKEPDDVIENEEFLDEEFDLDDTDFGESDVDTSKHRQRIMKPEMMDEEIPSDAESRSDEGSLYDEFPSSDSEDLEDWFQMDIRAEKAGDYIPLLGSKAKDLLLEEKRRVAIRLQVLKQNHKAFYETAKKQAEDLKKATMALAELDDMLKAS